MAPAKPYPDRKKAESPDIIVIGGGPAGLMAAGRAGELGQVEEVGHALAAREAGKGRPLRPQVAEDGSLKGVLIHRPDEQGGVRSA